MFGGVRNLTLATRVTILRILGIPVFILLALYYLISLAEGTPLDGYRWAALSVFVLVASTDALDGYLARSRNEVTRLGKILDPIADKGLLVSSVILFTRPGLENFDPQFPIWYALLVLSRDAVLVIGAYLIHNLTGHVEVEPRLTGKAATFLQMLAIVLVLAAWQHPAVLGAIILAGLFTFISGMQYLFDGFIQFEKEH